MLNTNYYNKYHKYKNKYLTLKYGGIPNNINNPYDTNYLKVDDIHSIYYEQSGNPSGIPIIWIHGGPGGALAPRYKELFDLSKMRIIGYEQRGAGRSIPFGSLENNTPTHLVEDLEKLRIHLKIDKWILVGNSWGSTLSLLYAIKYPEQVLGIIIGGVCLLRQKDIDWLYKKGASYIYPKEWDTFINFIPINERDDLISAYYKRLTSPDEKIRNDACWHWCQLELIITTFDDNHLYKNDLKNLKRIVPLARLECHFFINNKEFMKSNNYIIENSYKLKDIPIIMSQSRYDMVCPVDSAYQLKKVLPHIELRINPLGGHTSFEKNVLNNYKKAIKDFINKKIKTNSKYIQQKAGIKEEIKAESESESEKDLEKDLSYPIVTPFNTNFLAVGDNHQLYYEEYGNKDGIPFLFIHGGPGSGISKRYSCRFDLSKIYLIGFDQRGAGRSIPSASITNNTTADLIKDIEKLRTHLKVKKWYLFGCSWGSTLSLLYSIAYPSSVLGMVIYGIFLGRQVDIDWLYKDDKVSYIYPDEWDKFIKYIPEEERNDLVEAYYKRINSDNIEIRNKFSLLWKDFETNCSKFLPDTEKSITDSAKVFSSSRIENHYMKNKCFLPSDNFILENSIILKKIPIYLIQARYDMVCPVDSSYQLYKELPHINYKIINYSNHDSYIKVSNNALINAVNEIIKI